jgi:hypothetical protein
MSLEMVRAADGSLSAHLVTSTGTRVIQVTRNLDERVAERPVDLKTHSDPSSDSLVLDPSSLQEQRSGVKPPI